MTIPLINGCGQIKYLTYDCPTIEPVAKIDRIFLKTDSNSQLTQRSSYDAVHMLKKHRIKENYNDVEIKRLRETINKIKERDEK